MDVGSLTTAVGKLVTKVDLLTDQVTALGAKTEKKDTNWGWVIGAVGISITIGTLAFTPVVRDTERIERMLQQHINLDGHPETIRMHTSHGEQFNTIGEKLEAIADNVAENRHELDSIRGDRFSKEDWNRVQDTILSPISRELEEIQRTRYRGGELELRDRLTRLEQELKDLIEDRDP